MRCRRSLAIRACSARRPRSREWRMPCRSACASGTTRLPASVGVEARQSATWSSSGSVDVVADRRDDGGAGGGDRADQGLVAERQEVLDRAAAAGDDDDVDVGPRVELLRARPSPPAPRCRPGRRPRGSRSGPWASGDGRSRRRPSRRPPPGRRSARRCGAGTAAGACGRRRTGPRRQAVRLRCSTRARSSPTPTGRIWRASSMSEPRWVQKTGLAWSTTRAPWVSGRRHRVEGVHLDRRPRGTCRRRGRAG